MKIITEIICKDFEEIESVGNRIFVPYKHEDYYIIPISNDFDMGYDDEYLQLTFTNQLLWLKHSNNQMNILIKDNTYSKYVVIEARNVYEIYVTIQNYDNYIEKNTWHTRNNVPINRKHIGKYMIAIPIIDDLIEVLDDEIHIVSNEIILKKIKNRGNGNGYFTITNNIVNNRSAIFVELSDKLAEEFMEMR